MQPPITLVSLRAALSGRYESIRRIASGGQATVYRATDVSDGQAVALKLYHSEHVEERGKREMEALAGLVCPSIARLTDSGVVELAGGSFPFVVTEFVEGGPLGESIVHGPESADVARIGVDVAAAIGALWSHRLVHRDLKPGNIMRKNDGRAVVIDLGIARHMQLSTITTAGVAWGTPGYMSPEQMLAQRALTCKSDVFALGIVLQECVLGSHPTGGRQHLLAKGGLPTASLRNDIPRDFCALVDRMVQQRSVLRPGPVEVATTLAALATGED